MDAITALIVKTTYTLSDFQVRLRLLRSYYDHKFFGSPLDIEESDKSWLKGITTEIDSLVNQTNYQTAFQKVETWLKNLEPLILSLPAKLSTEQLSKIADRIRQEFGKDFLFELRYQPELIGGVVLIWKGKYYDYSFKKKLKDHDEQIKKIIRGYFS